MTTIRLAAARDGEALATIYGPHCASTPTTFETEPPSPAEMATRVSRVLDVLPWLVVDVDGTVAGYAYASKHRERAAYRWAVDTAVYVDGPFMGRGIGRALYTTLLELLRQQGVIRACAGITLPNPASLQLHRSVGFRLVGVYERIGFKLGAWHDVAWYQLDLDREPSASPGASSAHASPDPQVTSTPPAQPTPLPTLLATPDGPAVWSRAVALGIAHVRGR